MEVRVVFNLDTSNPATDGKIQTTIIDEDGIVTPGIRLKLGITSPLGIVIKAFPSVPDVTIPSGGSNTWTYDIPVTTSGGYEQGDYSFRYEIDNQNDPALNETKVFSFATGQKKGVPNAALISTSYACNSATITVVDKTDYGASTIATRTLSILPPNVPGYPPPTLATGIGPSFTQTFAFENAVYQCGIFTVATDTITSGVFIGTKRSAYASSFSQVIYCNTGVCALTACMDSELAKIEAKACNAGGIENLPMSETARYDMAARSLAIANNLIACGKTNEAAARIKKAWEYLDDGCGCGCTDNAGTAPVPYP